VCLVGPQRWMGPYANALEFWKIQFKKYIVLNSGDKLSVGLNFYFVDMLDGPQGMVFVRVRGLRGFRFFGCGRVCATLCCVFKQGPPGMLHKAE
jgi:hypothetical protein